MKFKLGKFKRRNCCKLFTHATPNEAVSSSAQAATNDGMFNEFRMKKKEAGGNR
jgi:hypothetical protein